MQAVTYAFKRDPANARHTGYLAQALLKIAPEFVRLNEDGYYQVYYDGFIPWITEAIKALDAENATKDRKIQELEARLEKLERSLPAK